MRQARLRVRSLKVERLMSRELMAADLVSVGAFCPALSDPSATVSSIQLAAPVQKAAYTYEVVGDAADTVVQPRPGLALMGGGADVDAAFAWMGSRANGGDFVVLSASKNAYAKYIKSLAPLNSVATLVVTDRAAANDNFVSQVVSSAEAIFIAGGDQANYILNWAGTKLETAIYTALARGAVLGGASAGLAVLGDVDYAALNDSTTSAVALANPLASSITLDDTFITPDDHSGTVLGYMQETITDSHFMQRDRMGRTLSFMARADYDNRVDVLARGIAINEQTALLIDGNGQGKVVGNPYAKRGTRDSQQRSVYMLSPTVAADLSSGGPLNFQARVQRLNYDPLSNVGDTIDLNTWSSTNADDYTINVVAGVLDADMVGNPNVGVYGPIIA